MWTNPDVVENDVRGLGAMVAAPLGANATTVDGYAFFDDGAAPKGPYTNQMLWDLFDPTDGDSPTPYVYDAFEWPHCEAQGYPLSLIGNATNDEASGKAMVDTDVVEYVARR